MTPGIKSAAGLLALLFGAVALLLAAPQTTTPPAAPSRRSPPPDSPPAKVIVPKPRTPRRVSLDPAQFTDPDTRKAYQIAKDNPKLLEKMACYCGCMTSPADAHTSNYECFVDKHGAGCAMCRRIALEAQQMATLGTKVTDIKREIDARYAH
jgi:hypothetical protein